VNIDAVHLGVRGDYSRSSARGPASAGAHPTYFDPFVVRAQPVYTCPTGQAREVNMSDQEPAALLQAIGLVMPFTGTHGTAVLRRTLAELVSGSGPGVQPADMTTPPVRDATDGAACPSNAQAAKSSTSPKVAAGDTTLPACGTQAAPRKATASNDTPETAAWLTLRAAVRELHPDNAGLAAAVGLSASTLAGVMGRRAVPSNAVLRRLQTLLSGTGGGPTAPAIPGPEKAQGGTVHPPAALSSGNGASPALPKQVAAGNGQGAQAAADDVKALAAKLRAKRRPLPLTSTTLAGQIGVEPDELDAALHARPVPPQAAERLAAWAAG
jgi:hypothetical protein